MHKGTLAVSQVVAALVLLAIGISLSAFLYVWLNSVSQEAKSPEAKIRMDVTRVLAEIKILEAGSGGIYIENTGGRDLHDLRVFVNSTQIAQRSLLEVGSLWVVNYTGLNSGDVIVVTTLERVEDRYVVE